MADNLFSNAMNVANQAFSAIASETFEVHSGGAPSAGPVQAVSVDELENSQAVIPGGLKVEGAVSIYILKAERQRAGIKDNGGTVINVRGRLRRVKRIADDGDDTEIMICESATMTVK